MHGDGVEDCYWVAGICLLVVVVVHEVQLSDSRVRTPADFLM